MRCGCDQLVDTLKGGLDLGSGVCVPMEFKEKERQRETVFLHGGRRELNCKLPSHLQMCAVTPTH